MKRIVTAALKAKAIKFVREAKVWPQGLHHCKRTDKQWKAASRKGALAVASGASPIASAGWRGPKV